MDKAINFYNPLQAAKTTTMETNTSTETTVMTITDSNYMRKSYMTFYYTYVLGSGATSILLRYYASPDNGTTYYAIPSKNTSGVLSQTLTTIVTATAVTSIVDSFQMPAATAIKVTAISTGGTATIAPAYLILRDN